MANNHSCPPECRVRLTALEAHKIECEQDRRETYKHWEEEVKALTTKRTFFWLIGWMVFVLVASFGLLYSQGASVQSALHSVEKKQVAVQVTLADLVKHHDSGNNAAVSSSRKSDSKQE